jgi:photosystem II stability/assembly factor-like uncharacterized protein
VTRSRAGAASSRTRARGVAFTVFGTVVLCVAAAALGACGGATPADRQTQQAGPPPAPAPGILAWAVGEEGDVLATRNGGAQWTRVSFFLHESGTDIDFSDATTGWLATDAGTVLRSGDGGRTWKVAKVFTPQVKAIAAGDAEHAWVICDAAGAAGEPTGAYVFRTSNGGATWQRTGFGDAELSDVSFSDARHGVLVALDRIWTTADGGETWALRRSVPMTVLERAATGDRRHAWVVGWGTQKGECLVFATADGGRTWTRRKVEAPGATGDVQPRGIACSGADDVWVTIKSGGLASTDGGRTWKLQAVGAGAFAVAAADGEHIVVTAATALPMRVSGDGGATWRSASTTPTRALAAVDALKAPAGQ